MDIFIRLDLDVEQTLSKNDNLIETNERARSALMFFCKQSGDAEPWKNSAYLRAGLNEFYSIEDAARRDWKRSENIGIPPRIRESSNPLVHLMYLLRHVNVHAQISNTRVEKTALISKMGGVERELDHDAVILDQPTLQQLLRSNEAKTESIRPRSWNGGKGIACKTIS